MAEQAVEALYHAGFEQEQMRYSVPGNAGSFFEGLKSFFTGTSTYGGGLANDANTTAVRNFCLPPFESYRQDVGTPEHEREAETAQPVPSEYHAGAATPQASQVASESEAETRPVQANRDAPDEDAGSMPAQADVLAPEHETDSQAPEQESASQNALPGATGGQAEDWTAQTDVAAPEAELANQAPQANLVRPEQTDELHQLQEQLQAAQLQLQEAKTQLQTAKERETQLQLAREREQQLQTVRRQLQEVQSELAATLADLGRRRHALHRMSNR